jgi:hypothetical protein
MKERYNEEHKKKDISEEVSKKEEDELNGYTAE